MLREHALLALVGVERVGEQERLDIGRHHARGLDARAPVAAREADHPVGPDLRRERVALHDRVRVDA
jgi:hypothetical protein